MSVMRHHRVEAREVVGGEGEGEEGEGEDSEVSVFNNREGAYSIHWKGHPHGKKRSK